MIWYDIPIIKIIGLTIGLMTLDEVNLELLAKCGNAEDRIYASKIIPIRKDGYFLLVSLLLANTVIIIVKPKTYI